jgi:hypothetical protein
VIAVFGSPQVVEHVKRVGDIHIVTRKVTAQDSFILADIAGVGVRLAKAGVAALNSDTIF